MSEIETNEFNNAIKEAIYKMEQRKAVMEQIKNEMDKLKNAKEEDHERIAKEYKEKVDEIFTKMKENKTEEDK